MGRQQAWRRSILWQGERLELNLSGYDLSDSEVLEWEIWVAEEMKRREHWCSGVVAACCDFSNSGLTDYGLQVACDVMQKASIKVERLKLYQNRIRHLTSVVNFLSSRSQRSIDFLELHLSHNEIGDEEAALLLASFRHARVSVWVRVERNSIRDAWQVIADAKKHAPGLIVDRAMKCGRRQNCHVVLFSGIFTTVQPPVVLTPAAACSEAPKINAPASGLSSANNVPLGKAPPAVLKAGDRDRAIDAAGKGSATTTSKAASMCSTHDCNSGKPSDKPENDSTKVAPTMTKAPPPESKASAIKKSAQTVQTVAPTLTKAAPPYTKALASLPPPREALACKASTSTNATVTTTATAATAFTPAKVATATAAYLTQTTVQQQIYAQQHMLYQQVAQQQMFAQQQMAQQQHQIVAMAHQQHQQQQQAYAAAQVAHIAQKQAAYMQANATASTSPNQASSWTAVAPTSLAATSAAARAASTRTSASATAVTPPPTKAATPAAAPLSSHKRAAAAAARSSPLRQAGDGARPPPPPASRTSSPPLPPSSPAPKSATTPAHPTFKADISNANAKAAKTVGAASTLPAPSSFNATKATKVEDVDPSTSAPLTSKAAGLKAAERATKTEDATSPSACALPSSTAGISQALLRVVKDEESSSLSTPASPMSEAAIAQASLLSQPHSESTETPADTLPEATSRQPRVARATRGMASAELPSALPSCGFPPTATSKTGGVSAVQKTLGKALPSQKNIRQAPPAPIPRLPALRASKSVTQTKRLRQLDALPSSKVRGVAKRQALVEKSQRQTPTDTADGASSCSHRSRSAQGKQVKSSKSAVGSDSSASSKERLQDDDEELQKRLDALLNMKHYDETDEDGSPSNRSRSSQRSLASSSSSRSQSAAKKRPGDTWMRPASKIETAIRRKHTITRKEGHTKRPPFFPARRKQARMWICAQPSAIVGMLKNNYLASLKGSKNRYKTIVFFFSSVWRFL